MESEDDNFHDFQAESQGFQLPALHFCWNFGINYIYIYISGPGQNIRCRDSPFWVPAILLLHSTNTTRNCTHRRMRRRRRRRRRRRWRRRRRRRRRRWDLEVKSNNPHQTGGEKPSKQLIYTCLSLVLKAFCESSAYQPFVKAEKACQNKSAKKLLLSKSCKQISKVFFCQKDLPCVIQGLPQIDCFRFGQMVFL